MRKGELYKKLEEYSYKDDVRDAVNTVKNDFPIKYVYDAWEMPETNKDKENKICEVLQWFLKYFGTPIEKASLVDEPKKESL
jgi:hypothetical protein